MVNFKLTIKWTLLRLFTKLGGHDPYVPSLLEGNNYHPRWSLGMKSKQLEPLSSQVPYTLII